MTESATRPYPFADKTRHTIGQSLRHWDGQLQPEQAARLSPCRQNRRDEAGGEQAEGEHPLPRQDTARAVHALHDETRWGFSCLHPLGHCRRPEASACTETPGLFYFSAQPPFRARGWPASLRWAWRSRGQSSQSLIWNVLHLNWHLCKAWLLHAPSPLWWWRCSRRSLSGLSRGPCCIAVPQPPA